jgi:hypothetical protein
MHVILALMTLITILMETVNVQIEIIVLSLPIPIKKISIRME